MTFGDERECLRFFLAVDQLHLALTIQSVVGGQVVAAAGGGRVAVA